jgi:hypothetical protein
LNRGGRQQPGENFFSIVDKAREPIHGNGSDGRKGERAQGDEYE